jgi:hypothetical protein
MDLQLTNIEHFSECDVQAKIKQLKVMSQLFCKLSMWKNAEKGRVCKSLSGELSIEPLKT